MMKFRKKAAIILLLLVIMFSGFKFVKSDVYSEISENIELFGEIYKIIALNYVDDVNHELILKTAIQGLFYYLDPYTELLDTGTKQDIEHLTYGKYNGIGISVDVIDNKVTIVNLLPDQPAQRQGINIGDELVEINDKKINSLEDAFKFLPGQTGTNVVLKIYKPSQKDTVLYNIKREEIKINDIAFAGFYPENSNNVFIKLTSFGKNSDYALVTALKDLQAQKRVESIILDLRDNGGGLIDAAINLCQYFLPKGELIVSVKGKNSSEIKNYSDGNPLFANQRLIILVNENSASASEIVAGAIQDNDRGIILGNPTYGKGLVQEVVSLSNNKVLKITVGRYYTPSGRSIQKYVYNNGFEQSISDSSKFYTDQKRIVTSSSGIVPDTAIKITDYPFIVLELYGNSFFTDFAYDFYRKNSLQNYDTFSDVLLFNEFTSFTEKKGYKFNNAATNSLEEQLAESKTTKKKYTKDIENLLEQFRLLGKKELNLYKDVVVDVIRRELEIKYFTYEDYIRRNLMTDVQFTSALKIISNSTSYNKILRKN